MSARGMKNSYWLTTVELACTGWPPTTRPTSKLVPPMSAVMTLGSARRSASTALAASPADGPEPIVRIGRPAAPSAGTTPPDACMIRKAAVQPRPSSSDDSRRM